MSRLAEAVRLAKEYLKDPRKFSLQTDYYSYLEGCHEHICFPYRLLAEDDFKNVCPYHHARDFDKPEHSDYCDYCSYYGIIEMFMDKGKKNIMFDMHKSIVDIFEERKNGRD